MKDLAGLLNQLSLNTLKSQLIDHYQEVLIWTYLLNYKVQEKDLSTSKTRIKIVFYAVMLDI